MAKGTVEFTHQNAERAFQAATVGWIGCGTPRNKVSIRAKPLFKHS
jgi:hypothetical protein